ncbi:hypothetical protein [Gelidibacter maritimus]|uniref:Uncharacterized protein n=1 Tax=Gelidibacter maritimus TaxID=2761487 RepID=A0A7W2M5N7_9FLAO|nr:hypothetical protein [Gelidibacter maritimus]MBA6153169.1 hypothetical protein [Gelidibacter maritimus]
MKTLKQILLVLILIIGCLSYSQTPEQEKMMEKAERMRDSIMNTPEIKAIMKQAGEMEKNNKTAQKAKPIPTNTKIKDKYWHNTLASKDNNTLENWNKGIADLVFSYAYDSRNDKLNYVKVGLIKSDGTIELNPTSEVPVLQPLKNFKNSNAFYDIHKPDSYKYSNGDAGFKLNSYLLVFQNDQKIGTLTVGNSVKVTRNLLIPGDLYFGDEGYILSWVYVNKPCAIKAHENWKGDLSNTGTPLMVETTVIYDLSFKTGWNIVKTEVIGTHYFPDAPEEDRSRFKKHEHTVVAAIPQDATYFFRAVPNN